MIDLYCIAACDDKWGIAARGEIPWRVKKDLRHFQRITTQSEGRMNVCIMGRKTWESIPLTKRPLKGRYNIVLSRRETLDLPEGVFHAHSFEAALVHIRALPIETCFVIGGALVYRAALPYCKVLHITHVQGDYLCDTFFPEPLGFEKICSSALYQEKEHFYRFTHYMRKDYNGFLRTQI